MSEWDDEVVFTDCYLIDRIALVRCLVMQAQAALLEFDSQDIFSVYWTGHQLGRATTALDNIYSSGADDRMKQAGEAVWSISESLRSCHTDAFAECFEANIAEEITKAQVSACELLVLVCALDLGRSPALMRKGMPAELRERLFAACAFDVQSDAPELWSKIGKAKWHVCRFVRRNGDGKNAMRRGSGKSKRRGGKSEQKEQGIVESGRRGTSATDCFRPQL